MESKDKEKILDSLIDEFYNENSEPINEEIKNTSEYKRYKEKLINTSEKLNMINDDIYDFDINTLNIIEKAEEIKKNKKSNIEFTLFIFTALIVLSIYISMSVLFTVRILVISQIIFLVLAPWLIIPITILKRRGSVS